MRSWVTWDCKFQAFHRILLELGSASCSLTTKQWKKNKHFYLLQWLGQVLPIQLQYISYDGKSNRTRRQLPISSPLSPCWKEKKARDVNCQENSCCSQKFHWRVEEQLFWVPAESWLVFQTPNFIYCMVQQSMQANSRSQFLLRNLD